MRAIGDIFNQFSCNGKCCLPVLELLHSPSKFSILDQKKTSFDKTLNLILIDFTSFNECFFCMSSIFRGGSISVLYLYEVIL